ncbi:type II toxin-antitoxin system Phd/YefM family antitoxin [Streptomyces atratus]|jgi:antitoxin (DNA-binding transcriptional repressor) of toxin-antitoxin stability system|uniref:Antitoxin n=1 Tax=Streptomyces atratus TaxID=1893 RepID=A0A1K1TD84_STRAR|nr:type II toxin-antitoxin system Phd/YefM family antitoxin [Streptomyces atratus]SFW98591.1 Antitoxin component of toxin-antitoxin stability system, DNA-binding transcriptional repressor [Streptomyces atratus]
MSTISVREFSYNPSAVFARVEKGEAIQVTRHGNVIAILLPGTGASERYASLVAQGQIRLKPATTADLDRLPACEPPEDVSPLDILLAEREDDPR